MRAEREEEETEREKTLTHTRMLCRPIRGPFFCSTQLFFLLSFSQNKNTKRLKRWELSHRAVHKKVATTNYRKRKYIYTKTGSPFRWFSSCGKSEIKNKAAHIDQQANAIKIDARVFVKLFSSKMTHGLHALFSVGEFPGAEVGDSIFILSSSKTPVVSTFLCTANEETMNHHWFIAVRIGTWPTLATTSDPSLIIAF